jgi:hypothetical protein
VTLLGAIRGGGEPERSGGDLLFFFFFFLREMAEELGDRDLENKKMNR